MKIALSIALFLSTLSFIAFNNTIVQKSIPMKDTTYSYYDAARNKYILRGDSIEYIPVKPIESSSGVYNGGNYTKKEIQHIEREKLVRLFKNAITTKKTHTEKNIKPNPILEINDEYKINSIILEASSPINIEIKLFLYQLVNQ